MWYQRGGPGDSGSVSVAGHAGTCRQGRRELKRLTIWLRVIKMGDGQHQCDEAAGINVITGYGGYSDGAGAWRGGVRRRKSTAEDASESARHATRVPHCRRDLGLSSLKFSIFGGQRKGDFEK